MKNIIFCMFIILLFNACSVTNYNKVNSNLEFEKVSENERKTYIFFGKEKFMETIEKDDSNFDIESSLVEEYYEEEEIDPLEKYNRAVTYFNDYMYMNLLIPSAKKYKDFIHEDIRLGISNFFHNILFPIRFVNNLLQFKFKNSVEELTRFGVNSTIGILGFADPAEKYFDLNKKEEDFGQTLGYYGFGEGFHIVIPFLGPSNVRDGIGIFADSYANPLMYIGANKYRNEISLSTTLFKSLNKASLNIGKYESVRKEAIDLYPFIKNIYSQNRKKLIKE